MSTRTGHQPSMDEPAVQLDNLWRTFPQRRSSPFATAPPVQALADVSLTIPRGSRFGIVGESGSGKTTLMRLIAALDRPTRGTLRINGVDISGLREPALGFLRRSVQIVFQDPMGSLDPRMRIRDIIAEPLRVQHVPHVDAAVSTALEQVGLPAAAGSRYPHQFSGGQRQRISIARAIAPGSQILLADEAVSALDVTVRAQILALLGAIATDRELTLIFVSHDLAVVRRVCDQVAVLKDGRVVETGATEEVYRHPTDPYTRDLLAAVPTLAKGLAAAQARREDRARRQDRADTDTGQQGRAGSGA